MKIKKNIMINIIISLFCTGILTFAALTPTLFLSSKNSNEDKKIKINLEEIKRHKFKINEFSTNNYFGFHSIETTVREMIENKNPGVNLDKINIKTYLGEIENDDDSKIITSGFYPTFINKATIHITSDFYEIDEYIKINNNFSLFDMKVMDDFYLFFGNKRPSDEVENFDTILIKSIKDYFKKRDNLKKMNNELIEMGMLSKDFVLKMNPFLNDSKISNFNNENLLYSDSYSIIKFKNNNDPGFEDLINYGIFSGKQDEQKILAKYNVTFFQNKNEYHKKYVGDAIVDKGYKKTERLKNGDVLNFEYNDSTTIEEINNFLPKILVRSEEYIHNAWFVNENNFKFSYWTTASSGGRKYKNDEKISDLWGFGSKAPYFVVKIDSINEEYVSYKDISFNVYFKVGGLKWDGGVNNGK